MSRKFLLNNCIVFFSFCLLLFFSANVCAQDVVNEEEDEGVFYEVEEKDPYEVEQPIAEKKAVESEVVEEPAIFNEEEIATNEEPWVEENEEFIKEEEIEEKPVLSAFADERQKTYTVRTWSEDRDCLWNIAAKFYEDPWKWRTIWEANPNIVNPDVIYKGDVLVIPGVNDRMVKELGLEEVATEEKIVPPVVEEVSVPEKVEELPKEVALPPEEEKTVFTEEIEEETSEEEISMLPVPEEIEEESLPVPVEERAAVKGKYEEDTFIAPLDWQYDGSIIKAKESKILLSAYSDFVFIDCGKEKGVVPGSRFNIYRKGKIVKHPVTKKVMGVTIRKVGVLKVDGDIKDDNSSALIINSREPIQIGDLIKFKK